MILDASRKRHTPQSDVVALFFKREDGWVAAIGFAAIDAEVLRDVLPFGPSESAIVARDDDLVLPFAVAGVISKKPGSISVRIPVLRIDRIAHSRAINHGNSAPRPACS